uniref:Uncharacterized protein LOC114340478 n=1 Tax=Diabrotica virgifera virgifera TaxID=50390 RepID=A0A6P7GT80_DIAVI
MFAPSKTTDISDGIAAEMVNNNNYDPENSGVTLNEENSFAEDPVQEQASTSTVVQATPKKISTTMELIEELSPIPVVTQSQKRKRTNKSAHGAINTTPNLEEARKIQREKEEIEQRKAAKKARKDLKLDDAPEDIEPFLQHDDEDAACIYLL